MESFSFENTTEDQALGMTLLESHRYWSRKRLHFNIVVGLTGLISVFVVLGTITLFDFFGMVLWGIVANAFYSTGYILDSYIISKSKGEKSLKDTRDFLFWIGTIAYVIVGALLVMMYSLPVSD